MKWMCSCDAMQMHKCKPNTWDVTQAKWFFNLWYVALVPECPPRALEWKVARSLVCRAELFAIQILDLYLMIPFFRLYPAVLGLWIASYCSNSWALGSARYELVTSWIQSGFTMETACNAKRWGNLDNASATTFSLPFLYTILNYMPISLCISEWRFCSVR
jgi:hypothetical protein